MDVGDAKITLKAEDKASATINGVGASVTAMGAQVERASALSQASLLSMSKTMSKVGLVMMGVGAAIGVVALKAAADYESAMREVNTMLQLSETEFASFSEEVRIMSREMGVSAVDSAKAMYQAISAGIPKENAITFLEIATKAAIGGVTETVVAVDGMTTVLNAFKMPVTEAEHVADVMFTTVKNGKTTFEELSASMNVAAPIAATVGVSFEDLMATVATLTKQGAPTAQAFTQVRGAMVALIKPSAEMEELIDGLGYESGTAMLKSLGFAGAMTALRDAAGGSEQKLAGAMGRVEGLNALLGVTGDNAEMAGADLEAMTDTAEASAEAFAQMEESFARQMETLKVQLVDTAIQLGETLMPVMKDLVGALSDAVANMSAWSDAHPGLLDNIGKAIMLLVGGGGFLFAIAKVIQVVMQLRNALIAVQALSGPKGWALLAAGVGIAAASIVAFDKLFQTTSNVQGPTEQWGLQIGSPEWEAEQKRVLSLGSMASYATGGVVPGAPGQPVAVIAHGGEQFAGVGNSIGGTNVYVTVQGSVVSERDLVGKIRSALITVGNRNTTTGIA